MTSTGWLLCLMMTSVWLLCSCELDTSLYSTVSTPHPPTERSKVVCPSTSTALNTRIIHCLAKGEKFLANYFKKYQKNKFSRCSQYESFSQCINPILETCPQAADALPDEWMNAIELMNCDCNQTQNTVCKASLDCLEEELSSLFMRRCATVYQHNIKQKTQDQCHFLTDYVQCRERVVTSACGLNVGKLIYLSLKIAAWLEYQCDVRWWSQYPGFEYHSGCPRNLTSIMNQCNKDTLQAKVLEFHTQNTLVPVTNGRAIELACGEFSRYKACLAPYNQSCPQGVSIAIDHNSELRIYLMKMEHICQPKLEFSKHLQCYQSVLKKEPIKRCLKHWEKFSKGLDNVTAFTYYCKPKLKLSQSLAKELDKYRKCYEELYRSECDSDTAALVMGGLISRAFEDPTNIHLDHRPDCELHTMDSLSKRVNKQRKHRHQHHTKHRHKAKLKSLINKQHGRTSAVKHSISSGHIVHIQYTSMAVMLCMCTLFIYSGSV